MADKHTDQSFESLESQLLWYFSSTQSWKHLDIRTYCNHLLTNCITIFNPLSSRNPTRRCWNRPPPLSPSGVWAEFGFPRFRLDFLSQNQNHPPNNTVTIIKTMLTIMTIIQVSIPDGWDSTTCQPGRSLISKILPAQPLLQVFLIELRMVCKHSKTHPPLLWPIMCVSWNSSPKAQWTERYIYIGRLVGTGPDW